MCAANQAGQVSRSSSAWATSRDSILVVQSILQIPLPGFLRPGCYYTCFQLFSCCCCYDLLRPVTTCYDAMLMPYALCVASIRRQLSDRPKRPLRLRDSSAHSRAQWSTTKLQVRIGIALESHWNHNCT